MQWFYLRWTTNSFVEHMQWPKNDKKSNPNQRKNDMQRNSPLIFKAVDWRVESF